MCIRLKAPLLTEKFRLCWSQNTHINPLLTCQSLTPCVYVRERKCVCLCVSALCSSEVFSLLFPPQVVSPPRLSVCRTRRFRSTPPCVILTPDPLWAPICATLSPALHSKCCWVRASLRLHLAVVYVVLVFMLPNFQEPEALF